MRFVSCLVTLIGLFALVGCGATQKHAEHPHVAPNGVVLGQEKGMGCLAYWDAGNLTMGIRNNCGNCITVTYHWRHAQNGDFNMDYNVPAGGQVVVPMLGYQGWPLGERPCQ